MKCPEFLLELIKEHAILFGWHEDLDNKMNYHKFKNTNVLTPIHVGMCGDSIICIKFDFKTKSDVLSARVINLCDPNSLKSIRNMFNLQTVV